MIITLLYVTYSIFDESSDTKEEPEDDDSTSTSSSESSTHSENADSEKGVPGNKNIATFKFNLN